MCGQAAHAAPGRTLWACAAYAPAALAPFPASPRQAALAAFSAAFLHCAHAPALTSRSGSNLGCALPRNAVYVTMLWHMTDLVRVTSLPCLNRATSCSAAVQLAHTACSSRRKRSTSSCSLAASPLLVPVSASRGEYRRATTNNTKPSSKLQTKLMKPSPTASLQAPTKNIPSPCPATPLSAIAMTML